MKGASDINLSVRSVSAGGKRLTSPLEGVFSFPPSGTGFKTFTGKYLTCCVRSGFLFPITILLSDLTSLAALAFSGWSRAGCARGGYRTQQVALVCALAHKGWRFFKRQLLDIADTPGGLLNQNSLLELFLSITPDSDGFSPHLFFRPGF